MLSFFKTGLGGDTDDDRRRRLRTVMVRGWRASQIWSELLLLILTLFMPGALTLSGLVMRRKEQGF